MAQSLTPVCQPPPVDGDGAGGMVGVSGSRNMRGQSTTTAAPRSRSRPSLTQRHAASRPRARPAPPIRQTPVPPRPRHDQPPRAFRPGQVADNAGGGPGSAGGQRPVDRQDGARQPAARPAATVGADPQAGLRPYRGPATGAAPSRIAPSSNSRSAKCRLQFLRPRDPTGSACSAVQLRSWCSLASRASFRSVTP
jgi:hypothetical protein